MTIRPVPTPRSVAAEVVRRVLSDDAYAAASLDAELGRASQLEPRDRALATEIVYGTLRVRPWLERRLDRHLVRGRPSDDLTLSHLLIAAYQLHFLSRVPAFAVVDSAVGALDVARGKKLAAFANAVLRKVAAEVEREGRADPAVAYAESLPTWLKASIERSLGPAAAAFLASAAAPPPACVCVFDATQRGAWLARFKDAGLDAAPGEASPHAILVRGGGKAQSWPGSADTNGAWGVQEEGSQLVALALGSGGHERVLDACAGRGNKTLLMVRRAPELRVTATDLHAGKLARLRSVLPEDVKLETHTVDWSVGAGGVEGLFDAILVDAPCSGIGTIRRRPDLLLRKDDRSVRLVADLQRTITKNACAMLRPGGRLVFAVCSVLREEAEDVVGGLLEDDKSLSLAPFHDPAVARLAGAASTLRLLPHVHGTDGYFLASFQKKSGRW